MRYTLYYIRQQASSMQEADKKPQKEDSAMPKKGTPLIRNLLSNLILQADIKHAPSSWRTLSMHAQSLATSTHVFTYTGPMQV